MSDYEGKTPHLSTLQHGMYFLLIKAYWRLGRALPADDTYLARIAGVDRRIWSKNRDTIMAFFNELDGKFFHSTIEEELGISKAKSNNNKRIGNANAKRSGGKRIHISDVREKELTLLPIEGTDVPSHPTAEPGDDEPVSGYTKPFDLWWASYPKKKSKGSAAKAYAKSFTSLRSRYKKASIPAIHGMLLKATIAQAELWAEAKIDPELIPYPATWLNGSRFDDDDVVARAKGEKPKPSADINPATGKRWNA